MSTLKVAHLGFPGRGIPPGQVPFPLWLRERPCWFFKSLTSPSSSSSPLHHRPRSIPGGIAGSHWTVRKEEITSHKSQVHIGRGSPCAIDLRTSVYCVLSIDAMPIKGIGVHGVFDVSKFCSFSQKIIGVYRRPCSTRPKGVDKKEETR